MAAELKRIPLASVDPDLHRIVRQARPKPLGDRPGGAKQYGALAAARPRLRPSARSRSFDDGKCRDSYPREAALPRHRDANPAVLGGGPGVLSAVVRGLLPAAGATGLFAARRAAAGVAKRAASATPPRSGQLTADCRLRGGAWRKLLIHAGRHDLRTPLNAIRTPPMPPSGSPASREERSLMPGAVKAPLRHRPFDRRTFDASRIEAGTLILSAGRALHQAAAGVPATITPSRCAQAVFI